MKTAPKGFFAKIDFFFGMVLGQTIGKKQISNFQTHRPPILGTISAPCNPDADPAHIFASY